MIIEHNGLKIKLLGDPHLGKRFHHNVPLHRRGEREAMVWERFQSDFADLEGIDYHVCMGDLFDGTHVSFETIIRAYRTYCQAENIWPNTQFIILQGNHDRGLDAKATTAFDVFAELALNSSSIYVVRTLTIMSGMAFIPWQLGKSAEASVREIFENSFRVSLVFGHWDTDPRAGDNLIPATLLGERGVKRAFTGHVHLPSYFERDGVEVIGTGSMLAYAHGEGDPYVTLSLDEAREQRDALKQKCVRIFLQPGEKMDFTIDCLQLQVRPADTVVDNGMPQATLGEFNLEKIFDDVSKDVPLPENIEKELRAQWQRIGSQKA